MEVKSNGTKKEGDALQDGEGIVKKQSVTMEMELKTSSIKKEGEAPQEEEGTCKKLNVTMAMDVFDCSVCSQPLRPPIFQCSKGEFICSTCQGKLPESERTASQRSHGMERVVDSIFVPCKHGCTFKVTYYQKEGHDRMCLKGPCICPVSDCDFFAPAAVLLDHLTTLHEYPSKSIKYFVPFELKLQPGSHVLYGGGYDHLFLLDIAPPESLGHAVSLVRVERPDPPGVPTIGCSVCFSCFKGHHQVSTLNIGSPSQPMHSFCVVPKVSDGETDVMLQITIDLAPDYYNMYELEEEDDSNEDYDEDDDDEDDSDEEDGDKDGEADDHNGV
ncbi:hypothetical protein ACQ4PT_009603 [Festuca glaucescens]